MILRNFRTYQLALKFYKECDKVKCSSSEIRNQLHRASLSILNNLAEGSAKPTAKDRKRFYAIAFGSFRESQNLLQVLEKTEILTQSDSLGAHLYKLVHSDPGPK